MDQNELDKLKEALAQRTIRLPSDDSEPEDGSITVDLSKIGSLNYTSYPWTCINSIHVSGTTGSYNTIGSYGNVTLNTANTGNYGNTLSGSGTGATWTSMPFSNGGGTTGGQLELEGEGADVLINGRSLKEFMEKMESRLAILVPDPAKLAHFEALKRAYDHYKTLEALCEIPKPEDNQ
jgi:hypothetical protein